MKKDKSIISYLSSVVGKITLYMIVIVVVLVLTLLLGTAETITKNYDPIDNDVLDIITATNSKEHYVLLMNIERKMYPDKLDIKTIKDIDIKNYHTSVKDLIKEFEEFDVGNAEPALILKSMKFFKNEFPKFGEIYKAQNVIIIAKFIFFAFKIILSSFLIFIILKVIQLISQKKSSSSEEK